MKSGKSTIWISLASILNTNWALKKFDYLVTVMRMEFVLSQTAPVSCILGPDFVVAVVFLFTAFVWNIHKKNKINRIVKTIWRLISTSTFFFCLGFFGSTTVSVEGLFLLLALRFATVEGTSLLGIAVSVSLTFLERLTQAENIIKTLRNRKNYYLRVSPVFVVCI